VTGAAGSDETQLKSGGTDCAVVAGAVWGESSCESSSRVAQGTSEGDDFGGFESVVTREDFAVFESARADGSEGDWAAATQSVPTPVHNGDDDCEFDDFETAERPCAPLRCDGSYDGDVSIESSGH
jgi:hypothetical protein